MTKQNYRPQKFTHLSPLPSDGEEIVLQALFQNLPVAFYWMDKEGYLLGANDVELKILGINSLSEFIGKHVTDFGNFDLWKSCERIMQQNKSEILEESLVNPLGQKYICLSIKSPIRDEYGHMIGLVGITIDITSRKVSEELSIQAKDNLIDILVQQFPINFYWLDREGIVRGCNENQLREYGYDNADDFIGKPCAELTTSEIWENSKAVMEQNALRKVEENHIKGGNEKITYLSIKSPLHDRNEKVIGLVGVSINITDRKKAEEELRKAKEDAEAANARINAMAGSIAHELRTPLGTINMNLGCIETMTTDPSEENCEAAKESLGEIRKELESANTIINMLLMNIREQLDWQKEKMEVCSINNCIEEALRRYPFVEDQRSKVSWKKSRQDFSFKGNAIFMQHVIFNLLKNALAQINKAGKGEITIWTEKEARTEKGTEKEPDGFFLHFKDTASGVPKDILPHLFERFFSRTKNGTGLGLAFCKMVIESFSGTINCNSDAGKYMEIVIKFPFFH